jgi:translation initiation factor eIF-2B subunit alpha
MMGDDVAAVTMDPRTVEDDDPDTVGAHKTSDIAGEDNLQQPLPLVLQDLRRFLMMHREGDATTTTTTTATTTDNDGTTDERKNYGGGGGGGPSSSSSSSLFDMSVMATPVAAMKALLGVVQRSEASTMMGLQDELKQAREIMMHYFVHNDASSSTSTSTTNDQQQRQQQQQQQQQTAATTTTAMPTPGQQRSVIALASGCDLFLKYTTRTFLEFPDFATSRAEVLVRGERFAGISMAARDRISTIAADFIQEGHTVLTHGWSRVVAAILIKAAQTKHFDIVILEGRPDCAGVHAAMAYASHPSNIPTTIVLDSAMGYVMEKVDIVLVGAEAIVENGGCVNKMGTYALATCAKAHSKPFYVASESYKFARLYPLNQQDVSAMLGGGRNNNSSSNYNNNTTTLPIQFVDTVNSGSNRTPKNSTTTIGGSSTTTTTTTATTTTTVTVPIIDLPDNIQVENSPCDYTPATFITLLFTDLGVLTPSAVSDELIRLYQ